VETLVPIDPRRLPALVKRLRIPQGVLAKRANARRDDVSRFLTAMTPGGLMDRLVEAAMALAAEAPQV
jgi:hypothetical protein